MSREFLEHPETNFFFLGQNNFKKESTFTLTTTTTTTTLINIKNTEVLNNNLTDRS